MPRIPDDDAGVDAAFNAIVSGISGQMSWEADGHTLDARASEVAAEIATAGVEGTVDDQTSLGLAGTDPADERARRRALRKAERADDVAAFEAAKAAREAELSADDEHFVPPEPPPLPRLRGRTVLALGMMVAGIGLLVWPELLSLSGDSALILGLLVILCGATLLGTGLRRSRSASGTADGWDDGARL